MTKAADIMAAATPGPWEKSDVPGDTLTVYHGPSGGAIAYVNGDNETGPHHPDADARAIVTAVNLFPLYEAVREAAAEVDRAISHPPTQWSINAVDDLRAALDALQAAEDAL